MQNDTAGVAQQLAWSARKPGIEDNLLALEADTVAYSGRLREAREFSRRATDPAEQNNTLLRGWRVLGVEPGELLFPSIPGNLQQTNAAVPA